MDPVQKKKVVNIEAKPEPKKPRAKAAAKEVAKEVAPVVEPKVRKTRAKKDPDAPKRVLTPEQKAGLLKGRESLARKRAEKQTV